MTTNQVRHFRDGHAGERDLLGGKGANLAEMTRIGLPVPPGFTITTDAFRAFRQNDGVMSDTLWHEVREALAEVETRLDKRFGDASLPPARLGALRSAGFDARHDGYDPECRA